MNLNISEQRINNCLGNSVTKGNVTSENGFINFLQGLGNIGEGLDLDNQDNDKETNIDYSSLINLLNNIQNMNDLQNTNEIDRTTIEKILNLDNLENLLNSYLINNKEDKLEEINQLLLGKNTTLQELSKEEITLLNLIKESIQSEDNISSQNTDSDLKTDVNLKTESSNKVENKPLVDRLLKTIEDISGKNNLLNQSTSRREDDISYKELETNTLLNKNKIVQENIIPVKDRDLETLQKILNNNDSNTFMYPNNPNSNSLSNVIGEDKTQISVRNVNQEFMTEDIVKNINYLKTNGIEEIKIKLTPKELGDMTIKLIKTLEETKVHIIVSKDDVFDLVNKNIGDISKHLKDLNINVKEVSVDVKSNNEKFFSENLNQEFNRKNQQTKKQRNGFNNVEIDSVEELKENKYIDSNLNILI